MMARDDASGGSCPGCGAALPSGERLCSRCEVHWARHEAEADGLAAAALHVGKPQEESSERQLP